MNHEKIVSELEAWLDEQLKSYTPGKLGPYCLDTMSFSESRWGGKAIKDVLAKLADLKATNKTQAPGRLVFTDDGTKALVVGEDGKVIHEYTIDECGNPVSV